MVTKVSRPRKIKEAPVAETRDIGGDERFQTVKEFKQVKEYRIRVLKNGKGNRVDVRQYKVSEEFTGFTKRGITLHDQEQVDQLIKELVEARKLLPKEVK